MVTVGSWTFSVCLQATGGYKQVTTCEKKLKVAINGFGRIGRNFLRCWNGRESSLLDVVAINDSGGVKQVWQPCLAGLEGLERMLEGVLSRAGQQPS